MKLLTLMEVNEACGCSRSLGSSTSLSHVCFSETFCFAAKEIRRQDKHRRRGRPQPADEQPRGRTQPGIYEDNKQTDEHPTHNHLKESVAAFWNFAQCFQHFESSMNKLV